MNYKEVTNMMEYFGAKSLNCASEIAHEFEAYSNYNLSSYAGLLYIVGKAIMTIAPNNRYVYLFKTANSKRPIVTIKTPDGFPYLSYDKLLKLGNEIITEYNFNYNKLQ